MSKCYTMDQRQLSQHDAETGQPCAKRRKWTWTKTWHLFTNINSHWITDLEAKCETIKLPADTEETLDGLECGNDFRANTEGITREKRKRIDRQGKTLSREWKGNTQNWRICLQITYPIGICIIRTLTTQQWKTNSFIKSHLLIFISFALGDWPKKIFL